MKLQSRRALKALFILLPFVAMSTVAQAKSVLNIESAESYITADTTDQNSDVVGTWKFSYQNQGGEVKGTLTITEEEGRLGGNIKTDNGRTDSNLKDVKYVDGVLSFKYLLSYNGNDLDMVFSGKVNEKDMAGAIEVAGFTMGFDLTATKE